MKKEECTGRGYRLTDGYCLCRFGPTGPAKLLVCENKIKHGECQKGITE